MLAKNYEKNQPSSHFSRLDVYRKKYEVNNKKNVKLYFYEKKFNLHNIFITITFSNFTYIKTSIRIINPILNE